MLLTLDDVSYTRKPTRAEFGQLTQRLKKAQPRDVSKSEFCEHLAAGKSWIGGAFADGLKTLTSWQVAALDFDDGTLDPVDALDRCDRLQVWPLLLYFTLSATLDKPRFRIVFELTEPVSDEKTARLVISKLLAVFPEADQSCKNPNRVFLGSGGEIWKCWRAVIVS